MSVQPSREPAVQTAAPLAETGLDRLFDDLVARLNTAHAALAAAVPLPQAGGQPGAG